MSNIQSSVPNVQASRARGATAIEWLLLAGVFTLTLLPFTCTRKDRRGETELRLWAGGSPEDNRMFADATRLFEAAHPGIRVKLETPPGSRLEKYLAAMQAGSCADVLWVHWREMPALAAKKVLEPLGARCRREGYDLDDFYPGALDTYLYEGELYALPHKGSTMFVFYNKDLFDRGGVAYPSDAWTFDDFLAAARQLTRTDDRGRLKQIGCLPYDWASWVWSAGGELADDDMTRCSFTDPRTLDGLRFYADLRNRWHVTTRNMDVHGADPAAVDVFEKGNVAMAVSGPWMFFRYLPITRFRWDIALFPKGPAGRQTRYAGMGIAVWAGSAHKELAWELAKFLCGKEAGGVFSKGFLDVPARRSVATEVFAKQEAPFDMSVLLRSMAPPEGRIRVFPRSEKWPHICRFFEEEIEDALLENKPLEGAAASAQAKAERYLAETRATAGAADYVGLAVLAVAAALGIIRLATRAKGSLG